MKEIVDGITVYYPSWCSEIGKPAINVKVHTVHWTWEQLAKEYDTKRGTIEIASLIKGGIIFEFWDNIEEIAQEYFPNAGITQEGRSGGWLVLQNVDWESWDDEERAKWFKFEERVNQMVQERRTWGFAKTFFEQNLKEAIGI